MARLPRLVVAGQAHLVLQRSHDGVSAFADADDRDRYLASLRDAAQAERVQVHAWALLPGEALLLATPAAAPALARLVQALGRRYVSAHHRRHGGRGTLWDGRFRCGVVEPGGWRLQALALVDGAAAEPGWTSAAQRLGGARNGWLVDPPEYWALGNTPFEREAAWRARLEAGLAADAVAALRHAAGGGWVLGTPAFRDAVAATSQRPVAPRPRGRPRRGSEAA